MFTPYAWPFFICSCNLSYGTLGEVKQRGILKCGVSDNIPGFSQQNDGVWKGFDVDFCRSVAAAVLGDSSKVSFVPLSSGERFDALSKGQVDLLARNSTWTFDRDARFDFAAITYYDEQGILAKEKSMQR